MKKYLIIGFVCIASFFSTSCMTMFLGITAASGSASTKKTFAENTKDKGPNNSVLIYTDRYASYRLYQQNPKIGYASHFSYGMEVLGSGIGLVGPVEVGSEFAISYYTYTTGRTTVTCYVHGIQGVDFKVTKPGLYYMEYFDEKHEHELSATKSLLSYVKGTEWEDVVKARISELENEKK